VLFAAMVLAGGIRAADEPQAGRFLLVFETSPALKKDLPQMRETMASLFSSNLQGQMRSGDDVAVWTVDQELHTGTFPLSSWAAEDAETYAQELGDFLGRQKFSKRASLAPLQPLLNRVAKSSDRLTVLIFCDSQGRLSGTPYDDGVNEIITNAATRLKGMDSFFVLVLRSFHGEYLGCSVNRSSPLNFPKFPPPPKPEPPPAAKSASAPPPVTAPVTGPIVSPVPAIIIVGTNVSTNASALLPPASTPAVTSEVATTPAAPVATAPPPKVVVTPQVATPPPNPPPSVVNSQPPAQPARTAPAPIPAPQKTSAPETSVVATAPAVTPAAPPTATPSNSAAPAVDNSSSDAGSLLPWIIGGGSLAVAALVVVWLMTRGRQPRGSLITSSMQDDPRLPPRK